MTDDYLERFVFVPCRFDSAPPHRRFALRATLARCPIGLTARFACALPGPSTALTQRSSGSGEFMICVVAGRRKNEKKEQTHLEKLTKPCYDRINPPVDGAG